MDLLSDIELLRRLVSFDSTSVNSNRPIADFIGDYLDQTAIRIDRNVGDDGRKVNLVATVGGVECGPQRDGLVLSGHTDVVPAKEPEWSSDPFTLHERAGKLFGRGAADMKGFLALAMNTARTAAAGKLRRPLVLLFTYDEELGSLGAQHFARTCSAPQALPRHVIVGEPTHLHVVRMHKGHLKIRVATRGRSAHSGYPELGVNAIEPAGKVIVALSQLRESLESERCPTSRFFPQTPYPALNVGRVQGGSAVNVVPDRCVVEMGVRLLPGMDSARMVERINALIDAVPGLGDYEVEVLNDSPPMLLDEKAPIYRFLCELVGQSADHSASYATDAGALQSLGLDCAVFGPGSIETAHKPNEFMPMQEFARAKDLLMAAVERFCISVAVH